MSTKNGQLLISRQQITLTGVNVIDTGLRQVNQAFRSSSDSEPNLAERTMVIPLPRSVSATGDWNLVRVGDPEIGPNGTVIVEFTWLGEDPSGVYNVLFWAPHTSVGPVDADAYALLT